MSGSVSCGVTALSPRSRCTQGFVCAHQESLFLQSWGSSIIKSCWPSKSDSWGFPVPLLELQVGKSIVGPRTFATLRELVWYNCAAASGLPTTWLYGRATGSVVGLTVTSFRRTNATLCGSQACYCRGPVPMVSHCWPTPLQETLTLIGRSGSASCGGHCSFPGVLVHIRFCLCPWRVSDGYGVWF